MGLQQHLDEYLMRRVFVCVCECDGELSSIQSHA